MDIIKLALAQILEPTVLVGLDLSINNRRSAINIEGDSDHSLSPVTKAIGQANFIVHVMTILE